MCIFFFFFFMLSINQDSNLVFNMKWQNSLAIFEVVGSSCSFTWNILKNWNTIMKKGTFTEVVCEYNACKYQHQWHWRSVSKKWTAFSVLFILFWLEASRYMSTFTFQAWRDVQVASGFCRNTNYCKVCLYEMVLVRCYESFHFS